MMLRDIAYKSLITDYWREKNKINEKFGLYRNTFSFVYANWQDLKLAASWKRDSKKLDRLVVEN